MKTSNFQSHKTCLSLWLNRSRLRWYFEADASDQNDGRAEQTRKRSAKQAEIGSTDFPYEENERALSLKSVLKPARRRINVTLSRKGNSISVNLLMINKRQRPLINSASLSFLELRENMNKCWR